MKSEVKSDWRLVFCDETKYLDAEFRAEKGITKAGTIYLVDFNLNIYICSATPVLEAWEITNVVEFESWEAEELDEYRTQCELVNDEPVTYFDTNMRDGFSIPAQEYMPEREPEDTDETSKLRAAYAMRAVDEIREYLAGTDPLSLFQEAS